MKDIRVLYVEDDARNREDLKALLPSTFGDDFRIILDCEESFENAAKKSRDYHLIILDLYQGPATEGGVNMGEKVFEDIKAFVFCPIVFYSGNVLSVKDMRSRVIGIVRKGEDNELEVLKSEILRLINNGIPTLREKVHHAIDEEFRRFFWETIQKRNDIFKADEEDFSLGYMLLRNFADYLSKDNIKEILKDSSIMDDKVHPMEFYIYPIDINRPYANGEIIRKHSTGDCFIILTPSCDFVERFKNGISQGPNAEKVIIVKAEDLKNTALYLSYIKSKKKDELNELKRLIESRKGDRFFFLPQTPFINNLVIDFQYCETIDIGDLMGYDRIAKLDSPYAQAMTSTFIRYYDRIGFPDIDTNYIIDKLGL